jgi:hypothetical protein
VCIWSASINIYKDFLVWCSRELRDTPTFMLPSRFGLALVWGSCVGSSHLLRNQFRWRLNVLYLFVCLSAANNVTLITVGQALEGPHFKHFKLLIMLVL